ncbi:hypothetical protein MH215_14820 [Paenibacillus sp. ACRSA]|uniref:hypothetical protein n=1 Tax=Paenibacillus sp. ACRSA TaxID=2918211 RepID=UPI001EF70FF7|nr:hypothetical protein [Paenibacillus sp. ACRSA]MCG7378274.1 hypothetical protein [Paenibacillus sp. ACRSA]
MVKRSDRNLIMLIIFTLVLILQQGCSFKPDDTAYISSQDSVNQILSNTTDNHSIIEFSSVNQAVELLFEEYTYGELTHQEDLGRYKIVDNADGIPPYMVTTVLSDVDRGNAYYTFLYSNGGVISKKTIYRPLPQKKSVAHKGLVKVFEQTLSEKEYIIFASAYSDASISIGIVPEQIADTTAYPKVHYIKMKVLP